MKTMSHVAQSTKIAFVAALAVVAGLAMLYVTIEPQITHSQSETFTIKTTVTGESSFLVPPSNIVMTGTINGLTGGQATGSTQFVVQSNSAAGYEVRIAFPNNGTANAMLGDVTADESIVDYAGDDAGEPSSGFTANASAQFAYTVTSSTTADTDVSFFESAGNCNEGAGSQVVPCWKAPETGNFTIVRRTNPASTGATSTVTFNVTVPNNPAPIPAAEGYTATATLSLLNL